MSVRVLIGNTNTRSGNTRGSVIYQEECALAVPEHVRWEFWSSTLEYSCKLVSPLLVASAVTKFWLMLAPSFDVYLESDGAGGYRVGMKVYTADADGTPHTTTLGPFAVTLGGTWRDLAAQFHLGSTSAGIWYDGVLKASTTSLPGVRINPVRHFVGICGNAGGGDLYADPSPATRAEFWFYNARLTARVPGDTGAARYALGAISRPSALWTDTGPPAFGNWRLSEATNPEWFLSQAVIGGATNDLRPRTGHANIDRPAGPWTLSAGQANPY